MISFFVGVPGSGKTYYAVDKIYNNFSTDSEAKRDKKSTFENCYTNINEFKFDKVEHVYPLDFDIFKKQLTELHQFYKEKKSDEFLIEKCKEYNILNTLFVLDEAHNYFDSKDIVLVWWLSYHRHLYHEIILITQNLSLIESKYKSFSEFFYKAFPQSLTLLKTHFKYNVYCSSRMAQNSKSGSIKIKRNKKVFELYKSGDSINSQNIILKFVMFSVIVFIFLVIYLKFYVLDSYDPKDDNNITATETALVSAPDTSTALVSAPSGSAPVIVESSYISTDSKLFYLNCGTKECFNADIKLPLALINYFVKNKKMNVLHVEKINTNYYKFYLDTSNDFYNYLNNKDETQNEKNNNGSGAFSILPSGK